MQRRPKRCHSCRMRSVGIAWREYAQTAGHSPVCAHPCERPAARHQARTAHPPQRLERAAPSSEDIGVGGVGACCWVQFTGVAIKHLPFSYALRVTVGGKQPHTAYSLHPVEVCMEQRHHVMASWRQAGTEQCEPRACLCGAQVREGREGVLLQDLLHLRRDCIDPVHLCASTLPLSALLACGGHCRW